MAEEWDENCNCPHCCEHREAAEKSRPAKPSCETCPFFFQNYQDKIVSGEIRERKQTRFPDSEPFVFGKCSVNSPVVGINKQGISSTVYPQVRSNHPCIHHPKMSGYLASIATDTLELLREEKAV